MFWGSSYAQRALSSRSPPPSKEGASRDRIISRLTWSPSGARMLSMELSLSRGGRRGRGRDRGSLEEKSEKGEEKGLNPDLL